MASVLLDYPSARPHHPAGSHRQPRPRSARRPPARAVFRRRRLCAALLGLGLVLTMARAAVAFDGSTLATSGRQPHVQTVVVQPGDTLWSIARDLAPTDDPRRVVDALVRARNGETTLWPGETITWLSK
jgi:Tfp pilus assembly protein FimV